MTDILSYGVEAQDYKNYQDYLEQQKEYAKSLVSQGAETLAEGSPLLMDTFRNVKKAYDVARRFGKQLGELKTKAEDLGSKTVEKGEQLLSSAEERAQGLKSQAEEGVAKMQGVAQEGLESGKSVAEGAISKVQEAIKPSEVEMKTFKVSDLAETTKRPTTFTAAGEQPESRTVSQYLRQKVDEYRQGRTRAKYSEEIDRDPEDLYTRINLNSVRSQAIESGRQEFNPATRQYESISKAAIETPETIESAGRQAIEEASTTLKSGVEGVQSAAMATAKQAAETGTEAATKALTTGSEVAEGLSTAAKEAAEATAKEAAATIGEVAAEIIPGVGEVIGTGALLYQGIKDIFAGEHTPRPVAMAAPSFTPGVAMR